MRTISLLFLFLTGYISATYAQATPARNTRSVASRATVPPVPADKWTGTWRMVYKAYAAAKPLIMELQVGESTRQMLYPALLKLDYPPFSGSYYVLLASKNDHQLGIGRGKYPVKETPFKLGIWMIYLNGTFNYSKPANAAPVMDIQRMWIKDFGIFMKGLYDDDEIYVNMKAMIRDLLYRDDIRLKKIDNKPWVDPATQRILHPENDSIYFGIYDRIDVNDSTVHMTIIDEDQLDKDTVTLVHNSKVLMNAMEINETTRERQIKLDTGMNILTFFADNYGRIPPNTGDMRVNADNKKYSFDFSDRANAYSTFMVAQLYRRPIPVPDTPVAAIPPITKTRGDTALRTTIATSRKDQWVTSLTVKQPQITLELWDGQTEDGDSISLRLNNTWVASGFPVKKQIQEIKVTLQPGENRLQFIADNLGRIPPNTAVLRVLFGQERKVINLNTDMKRNNVIRIVYDPQNTTQ